MKDIKPLYHNHIALYPNAVSNEYCDKLIKNYKEVTKEDNRYIRERKTSNIIEIKDRSLGYLDVFPEYREYFITNILYKKYIPLYTDRYSGYDFIFNLFGIRFDGFNLQETNPGEGYHVWHSEWAPVPTAIERTLVWTLYLNDVEEGGETEFLDIPFRAKPKKGTLCIFPSAPTHQHRGNPPLTGVKYIATGWIETSSKELNIQKPLLPKK